MDNVPTNTDYSYYWSAETSTAQSYSYYETPPAGYVPPNPALPHPPYNVPSTDYGAYNYPTDSYYSAPPAASNTSYAVGTAAAPPTYNYQTHASTHESQSYYGANYTQVYSSEYNYNWDPKCPYQAESKTESSHWVAETSSWSSQIKVSDATSKAQSNSTDLKYKSVKNGLHHSSSPDRFYSNKYGNRRKHDDYSNRYRDRSKERRNSRDRSYKRRSRSLDRKSYSGNNSYNNHSSARRDRSNSRSRSRRRSNSRSRSKRRSRTRSRSKRRSTSRSKSKRRSRSQESHSSVQSNRTNNQFIKRKPLSEREMLLEKYRRNYCATSEDIKRKMNELESDGYLEKKIWTRTAPADLYYNRDEKNTKLMRGTEKLFKLCDDFKNLLLERAAAARALQPPYEPPPRKTRARLCRHKSEACSSSSDSDDSVDEDDRTMEELMAKKQHPQRLHPEMWFNDPGEMNDGPLCRCSAKSRRSGIRHGIYAGEGALAKCDPDTNNADKLFHYRITISPPTNFLTKTPTIIKHDEHEFIFEGFSMLSHFPLEKLPTCKVIRFNIEYTILYIEEKMPENFTIRELDYFRDYLFNEVLELVDFDLRAAQDKNGCSQFHFMPRFVRDLPDNGQEILSMNEVLSYLLKSSSMLIDPDDLPKLVDMPQFQWQNFADEVKGMVVTYPGKKPCSVRVDQLDRSQADQPPGVIAFPEIVHFGIRPPQLSYAGNTDYQKAWRDYVKFRHLLANMPKPSFEDKRKLEAKENKLQELRTQSKMKRDVTVDVSSEGFYRTGIMCDIVQHAMLIPVLVCHLRFHKSLDNLEKTLNYTFKNRYLLQLALTHPSYRENFGTNPDHARNSLTNCGIRQPEYGDRRIHYMNTRKRGINTLINIMSRFGAKKETESSIAHNERLEFLGDAVVEFLTSIHLFHMFPDLEEGGLATYRAAIVQNQHLAVLAKKLCLEQYMLYAHGSDLCHDLELRHAMANCFEALMGALFLDGGIRIADTVFGETLFKAEFDLLNTWVKYPRHPLQEQEPTGDRQWIPSFELLQKLTKFEEDIGVEFSHIRLLARAFTDRSIGYTNLTLGSNQRLEFLGDTVLQLIVSEYLYKYFPEHHEGHLSLLRSSLVNNKTQAVVCDDLGMTKYALYGNPKAELKTKDRADLLEAFLGALYVDKGLEFCQVFCNVCFFPRLQDFIMNQDWNDPKSKLQQCCLTLRTMDGGEPDIPVYKVIECKGPTNTRVYTVAVYFQGKRLAKASGHSIQEAEMNSAKEALEKSQDLFPQLDHQKRVIAKSMKMQNWSQKEERSKHRAIQSTRYEDRNSDDSDNEDYRRKRRSRSRERGRRSRSRDRYDSSDRRMQNSTSNCNDISSSSNSNCNDISNSNNSNCNDVGNSNNSDSKDVSNSNNSNCNDISNSDNSTCKDVSNSNNTNCNDISNSDNSTCNVVNNVSNSNNNSNGDSNCNSNDNSNSNSSENSLSSPERNKSVEKNCTTDNSTSNCIDSASAPRDEGSDGDEASNAGRKRKRLSVSPSNSSDHSVSESDKKNELSPTEKKIKP